MAQKRAYLDYNASAPLLAVARDAVVDALAQTGNPSSVHWEGRAAKAILERARRDVAALVNAKPDHVFFTSGATEAASTLLTPHYVMGRASVRLSRLYVSASEHPCVLAGGQFAAGQIETVPVDRNGLLDLERLRVLLAAHDKGEGLPLVAVQAANNETGVLQPIDEIGRLVKAFGGFFVVDAVQAAGRIPLDIATACADYLILSSHKIGGPKGVGAIVAVSDLVMPRALVRGGGQEKGHRAGTEALPVIAGFGAAARVAREQLLAGGWGLANRQRIEDGIRAIAADAVIYGDAVERLANTTFFSLADMKAETVQIAFDLAGIALSAGSACSSGKVGPSHVLAAMGFGDGTGGLRVSTTPDTTQEEIALFLDALTKIVARRDRTKPVSADAA
ncbi:cysteine desulfurase family protein [Phyllobacterium myrsinacearum]|uniref:Cysteine desulfurase n=1 Tax=Phyllobacterium myrsinacearum TaxID=28101 RepID=A0A2S9JYL9_9HYPH|nr:cysteine desulfurase family protein [Phyllobacterium myrsinacearum]PRD58409.1 cysteine desulfurase [Phyllobacterium myrsinacearum]PWV96640.1 cysteine desulfurase [Phyllobacterium myrsinacearum]RZV09369.1 cysteine desulfurase [Phyllobacterium myrsinacearum]